jgi:hypothetical protein
MHFSRFGYFHFPYTIDVPGREHAAGGHADRPAIPPSVRAKRKGITMRISDFCFISAGLAALTGMGLGIRMGISQDFILSPAHAHLNLLGWVTMALYGLYHRGTGRTGGALGWTQVIAGSAGAALMSGGLAAYLSSDNHSFVPLIVVGSLAAVLGMILFMVIVIVDWRGRAAAGPAAVEQQV